MPIIFTKNLYVKEEVEYALLSAILLNQKETAIFWGLELFYSGYRQEVFDYLWTIYYDFHASLNPSFEKYFIRKQRDQTMQPSHTLATIITNLCPKSYTTEVYVLRATSTTVTVDGDVHIRLREWLLAKDYKSVAGYLLSDSFDVSESNMDAIREIVLKHRKIKWYRAMLVPSEGISLRARFLSHVMQICFKRMSKWGQKNLSSKRVQKPRLDELGHDSARQTLKSACEYGINCSDKLHLFRLSRHEEGIDIKKCYREDWLYYCSTTPYWGEKIREYGGLIKDETRVVVFESEIKEELFMAEWWLEPDEQPLSVQLKSICEIEVCKEVCKEDVMSEFCRVFASLPLDICLV
jgi:hypothetical protein